MAGKGDFASAYEGVDEGQYDPKAFYVRSVNKHDHRAETRVAMQPEVYASIQALISSGKLGGTPISSYQAFMRDAAVHNFQRLGTLLQDQEILDFAAEQQHAAIIEQEMARTEHLQKVVTDADARLNSATKDNDVWFAERLILLYEQSVITMREPYAAQLEEILSDARRWLRAKQPVAPVE